MLEIQKYLFSYQLKKNQSFIDKSLEVLVENKMHEQGKLFGRNNYLNSVIFDGDEDNIGKLVKVKINSCNQNSLFGSIEKNNVRAA